MSVIIVPWLARFNIFGAITSGLFQGISLYPKSSAKMTTTLGFVLAVTKMGNNPKNLIFSFVKKKRLSRFSSIFIKTIF
jgi:hypothetical protein